ncbi:MAG TPA: hypothetical protein EYH34_06720 [Planctomycetes bacterium]|nr:hypothetical protein [Planctomycetota bacterium]
MQCVNCQFENIPGAEVCGRCGASLRLAAAAIDVHPPRASRWAKRWRRLVPWTTLLAYRWNRLEEQVSASLGRVETTRPLLGVFARMLVPGWPQIYLGQVRRGQLFLGLYAVCLVAGLIHVGTFLGSLLLGLALSAHLSSVLGVVFSGTGEWFSRVVWTLGCWTVIGLVVYWPAVWAVSQVAVPQRIVENAPPFRRGDVILYNPSAYRWSAPEAGDVVLYQVPPTQVTSRTEQGYPMLYNIQGMRIDRIIAGPGQRVRWDGQRLEVDGAPSPWFPLNPARLPARISVEVPPRCYLVFPTTDPVVSSGAGAEVWRHVSLVPEANLLGKVYLRHQPLHRFWLIR